MRIRRATLGLTAGAVGLLAVLAPATPALAKTHTSRDATGDVVRHVDTFDEGSEDVSETTAPAPEHSDGDVIALRVDHRARRLVLTTSFASLRRPSGGSVLFSGFAVRTSAGRNYELGVYTSGRRLHSELGRANGYSVRCRGLATSVDYSAETVRASIPTGCLSSPRWVRVAGIAGTFDGDGDGDGDSDGSDGPDTVTSYLDDANRSDGVKDKLAFGPRVYRG